MLSNSICNNPLPLFSTPTILIALCNFNFCLTVLFGLWSWNLLKKRTQKSLHKQKVLKYYILVHTTYTQDWKKKFLLSRSAKEFVVKVNLFTFFCLVEICGHIFKLYCNVPRTTRSKLENEKWISAHCTQKRQKLSGGGGQKLLGTKWWKHFCQAENEGYSCVSYFHNKVGTDPFLSLRGMIYKSSPWQPGNSICTTTAPITNIPPFWSMPPALHCKWS